MLPIVCPGPGVACTAAIREPALSTPHALLKAALIHGQRPHRELHKVDWEKKFYISNKFIDERYKYFAQRLIYEEAPQLLPRPDYEKIHKNIAKQILSTDNEKWNTLPKSYHELDTLREKYEGQGDEEKLIFLEELDDFLQDLEKKYN